MPDGAVPLYGFKPIDEADSDFSTEGVQFTVKEGAVTIVANSPSGIFGEVKANDVNPLAAAIEAKSKRKGGK